MAQPTRQGQHGQQVQQIHQLQSSVSKSAHTVLLPEILSFSPHFLLDDIINIANDGVGRAVDAMEDFLNRWAETRLQQEPDWDADKELEQGLVSFQTLLEFHTDIAFDFFEAWSLRNIFAVTPNLPVVAPHHAGLDLDQPPEKEAELLAEIDELRRQIENQRHLKRLLTRASRMSRRHAKQAQARLDRLTFIQPDQLRALHALAKNFDSLYSGVSTLQSLDPTNADLPIPEPGKRQWEVGRADYISWASTQLIQHAQRAPAGSAPGGATAGASKEDMAIALHEMEQDA
ncbi:Mis12-domain-containing protein [Russula earlei]|uniref:Mis12-domain-containing protein n=1 Tax=Russula earlei TaxID=71964 RepID=A0ACC0U642_9AGAM|nr:Mis12-domain-containing protein [Russula earlei]